MKKRLMLIVVLLLISCTFVACKGSVQSSETNGSEENVDDTQIADKDTENTEEIDDTHAEVVFYNHSGVLNDEWGHILSSYKTEDDDTLYAFSVYVGAYTQSGRTWPEEVSGPDDKDQDTVGFFVRLHECIADLMLENGLMVVPDVSYYFFDSAKENVLWNSGVCDCVVVGTKEDIMRVFSKDKHNIVDVETDGRRGYFEIGDWYLMLFDARRVDYVDIAQELGWDEDTMSYSEWFDENKDKAIAAFGAETHITMKVPVIRPEETTETK